MISFRATVIGIARNTSILFFQQILTWGSTLLLMLFLPRYLGPVEYGRLFLAGSFVEIFRIIVGYGGHYLVTKEVSRDPGNTARVLVDAAAFRTALGVVSVFALLGLTLLIDYPAEVLTIIMISALPLLWHGATVALYAAYQGREMMQYTSYGAVAERVASSVVCVTALLLGADAVTIVIIMVLAGLLNFLVLTGNARKIVDRLPRVNREDVRRQIKVGIPYFLYSVFATIYYRIDSLMLSKLAPEEVVGWYGGAYRLFDILNFLPYILSIAVYPVLSRLWSDSQDTHRRTMQKSLEVVLVTGVPIALTAAFLARTIVQILYGLEGYASSVVILQILAGGLVFLYVDMVVGTTLLASDRQKQLSFLSLSAIAVNVALNSLLIGPFQESAGNGGIGSAISTLTTEFYVMIVAIWMLPKGIFAGFRYQIIPKAAVAGGLMAALYFLFGMWEVPWYLQVPAAFIVYAAAILALRALEPRDVDALRGAVREIAARVRPGSKQEPV